ncbi:hypothetical protein [Mandarin fish ranavirus]|nr:hypothetical protein [Mandarin fish ranavirus]
MIVSRNSSGVSPGFLRILCFAVQAAKRKSLLERFSSTPTISNLVLFESSILLNKRAVCGLNLQLSSNVHKHIFTGFSSTCKNFSTATDRLRLPRTRHEGVREPSLLCGTRGTCTRGPRPTTWDKTWLL